MEMKTCRNGHSYDASFVDCPQCAGDYGSTMPLMGVDMNTPMAGWDETKPTGPVWEDADAYEPQQYEERKTRPVNPDGSGWADPDDYHTPMHVNDAYSPTIRKNYKNETSSIVPVTGWLVCLDGPEKGKDYRLHSEINYIGRSKENDVVFGSDPTVSREKHAMIAYDERGNMFFFAPSNGSSIVRQNGRPVLATSELKSGDRLEIGEYTYIFMALCGEGFTW